MRATLRVLVRVSVAGLIVLPGLVSAGTVPKDAVYIHCPPDIGDLRLSDLNRTVAKFSNRYRTYRNLCSACNVTQWGNVITMDDESGVFVKIDRLKGVVVIKDRDGEIEDNDPGGTHAYRGTCARSQMVVASAPSIARRF